MRLPNNLKRKFRNFGIEGLMVYVTVAVGLVWAFSYIFPNLGITQYLYFDRTAILHGQVWRLLSFLFMPSTTSPLFMMINLYFYYFIGTNLEEYWGKTKFSGYYFLGALLLIISGFIVGYADAYYLYLSMFIAYALLAPDQQFMFFFIIPVKAIHLAILDGVFILIEFFFGSWGTKGSIIACVVLLMVFFGNDLFGRIKAKKRFNDFQKNFNNRNDR